MSEPIRRMSVRDFPVRPNLEQLKHQAKDLLREWRGGESAALELARAGHPRFFRKSLEGAEPTGDGGEGQNSGKHKENRSSGAKAPIDPSGFMPGLKPRPTVK